MKYSANNIIIYLRKKLSGFKKMKINNINDSQNENKTLISNNLNQQSPLNIDLKNYKQDILLFKNEVLKDLRKIDEKLNSKLSEYKIENTNINTINKGKIDSLFTKVAHLSDLILDNKIIYDKIKIFDNFKSKTQEMLLNINTKINLTHKESNDYFTKCEKIVNENLFYPGIIGINSKFNTFRNFVDFVLKNIKILEDLKQEINNINFNDYKKQVDDNFKSCNYNINNNNITMNHLIELNGQKIDSILKTLVKYDKKFEENSAKLEFIDKLNQQIKNIKKMIKRLINNNKNEDNNNINFNNTNRKNLFNKKHNDDSKQSSNNINLSKTNSFEKTEFLKKNNNKDNKYNNRLLKKYYNKRSEIGLIKRNTAKISNNNNMIKINEFSFDIKTINKKSLSDTKLNRMYYNNELFKLNEQKKIDSISQDIIDTSNNNNKNLTENINSFLKKNKLPSTKRDILYENVLDSSNLNSFNNINNANIEKIVINKNKEIIRIKKVNNNIVNIDKKEQNNENKINQKINCMININVKDKKKDITLDYLSKKITFLNNYSITNIPNIEFKKIILPDQINISENIDYCNKTAFSDNNSFNKLKNTKNTPFTERNNNYDEKFDTKNIFTKIPKKYNTKTTKIFKKANLKKVDWHTINNNKINLNSRENKFDSLRIVNLIKKDYPSKSIDNIKKIRNKNFSKDKYSENINMKFKFANSEKRKEKFHKLFKNNNKFWNII